MTAPGEGCIRLIHSLHRVSQDVGVPPVFCFPSVEGDRVPGPSPHTDT